jgi:tetratricopeptide (TPR) repeat protein
MKRCAALALALAFVHGSPSSAQAAPDPFYLSLLQEGVQALDEGDAAGAAKALRLACFGLLEDPVELAGCLVRLGLAQAEAGDREAFFETFRRLLGIEQRFGGYRRTDLPEALRSRFEGWLVRLVPEQQLAAAPAFSALALERTAVKIRRLAPKQRRQDLEERLAAAPGEARWALLLAELEIEEGDTAAALARVETVLAGAPADADARCVRGLARASAAACEAAVEDLAPCRRARQEAPYAAALLACQVDLSQWSAALDLLAALPAELRGDRRIARLAQRVEREGKAAPARPAGEAATAAEPPVDTPPAGAPAEALRPEPSAPAPAPLSASDRTKLERARQLAAQIQHAGQLEEPLRLAAEVAEANPGSAEAQHQAALIAYRASRWPEAAAYFRRGGDPGDERPLLLFYMAVSLFETGDRDAAAAALERALPKLERTPFVETYRRKILGEEPAPG